MTTATDISPVGVNGAKVLVANAAEIKNEISPIGTKIFLVNTEISSLDAETSSTYTAISSLDSEISSTNAVVSSPSGGGSEITSIGGDKFVFNGTTVSLWDLIMLIELQRANLLEEQLADELEAMAALNELIKEANDMLAAARVEQGKLEGNQKSEMPQEMIDFYEANGIEQGLSPWDEDHKGQNHGYYLDEDGYDYVHNSDEWETSIENLKAFIDGLNSRSQLDMLDISSLMKKRDESLTMPANTNSMFHQTNQTIISKIG